MCEVPDLRQGLGLDTTDAFPQRVSLSFWSPVAVQGLQPEILHWVEKDSSSEDARKAEFVFHNIIVAYFTELTP